MKLLATIIAMLSLGLIAASPAEKAVAPAPGASTPAETAASPAQTTPLAAQLARGKKIYQVQCLTCHQVDGTGVMNMNPPLVKTTYVLGDKSALVKIVLEGMKTPLTIDDYEYHNVMPPHTTMNDQEIADVLTFVRHSFGNKAAAVTAADVKAVRVQDGVK
ncbi:c-type cytochrome [Dinghuibacter silviterrae]|uniref:Mono/diheme cytochrome c family protein n=1 Tax=Dinghuibacter silviterrae TaxID=1539049 RepID=A0A4R8DUU6_9BACT|nr:cytochrome c [Dinghuibacter silviterrae]TDX00941.1 mono/diheme cytochrome c family protein [Dinghuibacter silviterrae]